MEKSIERKRKKTRVTAIALAAVLFFCCALLLTAEIAMQITDRWSPWRPDYAPIDEDELSAILDKETLSDADYALLYSQTGLTKLGIDGLLARGNKRQILRIRQDYFADYKVTAERFAPFTCWEKIDAMTGLCALETGDIIVTSATHVACWRFGHAALVLSSDGAILESFGMGTMSKISDSSVFQDYASFMVLRPKAESSVKAEIARFARSNLVDVPYRVTTGIFTKKNPTSIKVTQCAHLVWYAYKRFGIDLDSTGGGVVKPQDMANSQLVDVVQIYGFNPEKLWK